MRKKTHHCRHTILVGALVLCFAAEAYAVEGHMTDGNAATSCLNGTKDADFSTIDNPNEFAVAHSDKDNLTVAVCVSGESKSGVSVRYKSSDSGYQTSGVFRDACFEVSGASDVKAKAHMTNAQDIARYYICRLEN